MGMDESSNNNNNNFNNYNINNINNNNLMYNSENNNNNIIYNSDIDKRSSGYYHDILINKNQKSKSKKRFKFRVLAIIVGLFFILSIASLLFFIFFSSAQMTFQGFKFIETRCHLNSTRYIYKNENNSNNCQALNEKEWWYSYDKDFYKFSDENAAINKTTTSTSSDNKDNYESNIGSKSGSKSYSDSGDSSGSIGELICYQGIFNVYFNDSEGILLNGDINGLWWSDLDKVQTYLHQINSDKDQACYYNKHNTKEIIWTKPPSSFFNIVFIVIIGIIIIIAFVVLVVIFRRAFGPLSNAEEKANLLSSQPYYRYTSDKIYNKA